jgi:hypothetical protein
MTPFRIRASACLAGCAVFLVAPPVRSAEAPASTKAHVLFMGADLEVQRDKKYYRVEDVVGSELKIRVGSKEVLVPTRGRTTGLKVGHALKLAAASVKLDDLRSGPAYTTANDPARKAIAASGSAGGAAALQDLAQGQMVMMATAEAHAANLASIYANNPEAREEAQAAADRMRVDLREAELAAAAASQSVMYSSQNSAAAHADRMQGERAEGDHDAMEVSFKVSSPTELDDPHLLVLFRFQARDARPGDEGMVIHAQSLDPIGPKPRYVRVRQAGLPRGFKYLDCEVHIFNRGLEVATDASSKRLELTREEARQYVVIEHVGANKGATVPAAAVAGTLAPGRLKELTVDQLNRLCFAKVGADGALLGLYADEACTLQVEDAATLAIAGDVLFKPALVRGQPVAGVARLRFGGL